MMNEIGPNCSGPDLEEGLQNPLQRSEEGMMKNCITFARLFFITEKIICERTSKLFLKIFASCLIRYVGNHCVD